MSPVVLRLLVLVAILGGAAAVGWWWRRREGHVAVDTDGRLEPGQLEDLGLDPDGAQALGLLFSAPRCRPCDAAKEILGEVAAERGWFRWTSLDAGQHLGLVERHRVRRVPTVVVVRPDGRIVARAGGVPRKQELLDALDAQPSG